MRLGFVLGTLVWISNVLAGSFEKYRDNASVYVRADGNNLLVKFGNSEHKFCYHNIKNVTRADLTTKCMSHQGVEAERVEYKSFEIKFDSQCLSFFWYFNLGQSYLILHDNRCCTSTVAFEGDNVIMLPGMCGTNSSVFGGGYDVIERLGVKANFILNCANLYMDKCISMS